MAGRLRHAVATMSTRTRVAIVVSATAASLLALAGLITVLFIDARLTAGLHARAQTTVTSLAKQVDRLPTSDACARVRSLAATPDDTVIVLSTQTGRELCRSNLRQPAITTTVLAAMYRTAPVMVDGVSQQPIKAMVGTTVRQVGTRRVASGLVVAAIDRAPATAAVRIITITLAAMVLAGALVAIWLGSIVAAGATRGLDELVANVEAAAHETRIGTTPQVQPAGARDLDRIAAAFNELLARIDLLAQGQRQLLVDSAHQLRTPLTSARANLHTLQRLPATDPDHAVISADISAQLAALSTLIDDVVDLTSLQDRWALTAHVQPLAIDALARAAVDAAQARFPGHDFELELDEPAQTVGDADLLARALANVVDNAVRYAGSAGPITVRCTQTVIEVLDHGPGFGDADAATLLRPFSRGRTARTTHGSGLGLAMTHRIIELHRAHLAVGNRPGGGAAVRVELRSVSDSEEVHRNASEASHERA